MKRMLLGLFFVMVFMYNGCALADARAAILVERTTGRVLYEKNAHEPLPMASTTKVMTALVALENASLEDIVTASGNAFGVPGTSIYLSLGEQLTMEQMLQGLMLSSGNDAAVAIAEHVSGSVDAFCALMTARAKELGCENTVFLTPHGLPKTGHYATAWDMATIARAAMQVDAFRAIVSQKQARIPWAEHDYERVLTNKNKLLTTYPGANGIKTGYTAAAGRCLVFSAARDDMELIGVVLNCPNWFDEATAILNSGFESWQMVTLLSKGEVVTNAPLSGGIFESVPVIAAEDLSAPVRVNAWPMLTIEMTEDITLPIKKGDVLGSAMLEDGGEVLKTIALIAQADVPTATFRRNLNRLVKQWLAIPGTNLVP